MLHADDVGEAPDAEMDAIRVNSSRTIHPIEGSPSETNQAVNNDHQKPMSNCVVYQTTIKLKKSCLCTVKQ